MKNLQNKSKVQSPSGQSHCGLIALLPVLFFISCAGNNSSQTVTSAALSSTAGLAPGVVTMAITPAQNLMPVQIGCGYVVNQPCVTVTICQPGSKTCQMIPNILLTTSASGLRINSSALTSLSLSQQQVAGQNLAECLPSSVGPSWGNVEIADVYLGGQKIANLPFQAWNNQDPEIPSGCASAHDSTSALGINGVLGIGFALQDCGASCASSQASGVYFTCANGICAPTSAPLNLQVQNPVSSASQDNNGVVLTFPTVPVSGSHSITGYLIFGIDTKTNNSASVGPNVIVTDTTGAFAASVGGQLMSTATIDPAVPSIMLQLPGSTATCAALQSAPNSLFACSDTSLSALLGSTQSTTPSNEIDFTAANAQGIFAALNPNLVYPSLVQSQTNNLTLGLPFFLGRTVFIGFQGAASPLGTGPYFAF